MDKFFAQHTMRQAAWCNNNDKYSANLFIWSSTRQLISLCAEDNAKVTSLLVIESCDVKDSEQTNHVLSRNSKDFEVYTTTPAIYKV